MKCVYTSKHKTVDRGLFRRYSAHPIESEECNVNHIEETENQHALIKMQQLMVNRMAF